MLDIQLDPNGDLLINEDGDIQLTQSVRQAVKIRVLWFFDEWRFAPEFGVRYFEDIFLKAPNREHIQWTLRDEIMTVDEVTDVEDITVTINNRDRTATITLVVVTDEETFREEVLLNG